MKKYWKYLRLMCFLFILMHFVALAAPVTLYWVQPTWTTLWLAIGVYCIRIFAISAGYHRYFSHRTYETSRVFQFAIAVLGCSALQKGPLWWASVHRTHHQFSDREGDPHSPVVGTIWRAHIGWVLDDEAKTEPKKIPDLLKFWELRWLEQVNCLPGVLLAVACYLIDGWMGFLWAFVVGTVFLYHATFLVNSLCHLLGTTRFKTLDKSKNNLLAGILTSGEGWHNNHHHDQNVCRQGLQWWEIDTTYYTLRFFQLLRLVWKIKEPAH